MAYHTAAGVVRWAGWGLISRKAGQVFLSLNAAAPAAAMPDFLRLVRAGSAAESGVIRGAADVNPNAQPVRDPPLRGTC
jgi:hypothetical protein